MSELYVIVNRNSGELVVKFKKEKLMYYRGVTINEPVFKYVNKAKPIFFASKEKAEEKMNDTMVAHWMYVRKAKERELKRWEK